MAAVRPDPFLLLRELDQRSKKNAFALPQQSEAKQLWHGVGFRLGQHLLVTPQDQVREILVLPRVSCVPWAKSWVLGIANVRGMLLPILDLKGFLQGDLIRSGRKSRVLVVNHGGVMAGLLVEEVYGIKHFLQEELRAAPPTFPEELRTFLSGAFQQLIEEWGVFDMGKLVESPEFMQVAA